jgi:5-methylcytosine-specific restriction endonuclease McrA
VLVLNQSYEPLSICSIKKAIILLVLSKAEIVSIRNNKFVRSVNCKFPCPSIIKLMTYIKIPYKSVELTRKNIIKRDSGRCQYCGNKSVELTIDHVLPKSRGGSDTWENLTTACMRCNNRKGNKTPEEAGMSLLNKPKKPNHIMFMKQHVGKLEEAWKPFLFME